MLDTLYDFLVILNRYLHIICTTVIVGGTLFFEPLAKDYVAIAAGTLDPPTGLKTVVQIHVNSAGDYYRIDPSIRQRPD